MKWRAVIPIVLFLLLISWQKAFAAIQVTSTNISPLQVIDSLDNTVTVTISGASTSTISYFRPLYFKSGSGNYFGCIKTRCGTYYCGSDPTQYPSILGNGSISLTFRANTSSTAYVGDGTYSFIVRRCTGSGCSNDYDTAEQSVEITKNSSSPVPLVEDSSCPYPTPTPQPTDTPTPTPTPSPTPSPTPTPAQPTNIHLTEFVACPPSGSSEWIELYNDNSFDVTLTNWQMKDDKDNVSTINGNIGSKTYGVFDVHDLNNDIDTVRLYDGAGYSLPNETEHYDQCSSSMSWSKTSSGSWQQTPIITKGAANQFPTPVPSPTATPTPKPTTTPIPTLDPTAEGADVLGESTSSGSEIPNLVVSDAAASEAASAADTPKESPIFAIASIGLGLVGLISLGGYLWYDWKKKKKLASPTHAAN